MPRKVMVEKSMPGWTVEAKQTYRGQVRRPVLWRGMLAFFYMKEPLFEIEATLLESKRNGEKPYIAWPQRSYENNGQTKYKSMFWMNSAPLQAAAAEAAAFEAGILSEGEYHDRRTGESGKAYSNQSGRDYDPLDDVGHQ